MALNFYSDSISARLYRWFYGIEEDELSQNLCPYVRKLVLMYILILPYSLLVIPSILIEYFSKETVYEKNHTTYRLATTFGVSFVSLLLFSIIVTPYTIFFGDINGNKWYEFVAPLGICLWGIFIFISLYFLIKEGINYVRHNANEINSEDSIIVSYLKAKHDKLCPRITWSKKK